MAWSTFSCQNRPLSKEGFSLNSTKDCQLPCFMIKGYSSSQSQRLHQSTACMVSLSCICYGSGVKSIFLSFHQSTWKSCLKPHYMSWRRRLVLFAVKGKSNQSLSFSLMAAANMGVVLYSVDVQSLHSVKPLQMQCIDNAVPKPFRRMLRTSNYTSMAHL